jgi:hypothetical protein
MSDTNEKVQGRLFRSENISLIQPKKRKIESDEDISSINEELQRELFGNENISLIEPKKRKNELDQDILKYLLMAKNNGFHKLPFHIKCSYVFCTNLLGLISGFFLKYINEDLLKEYPDLIDIALNNCPLSIRNVPLWYEISKDVMLNLIQKDKNVFKYINKSLISDNTFIMECIQKNPYVIQYIQNPHEDMIKKAIETNWMVIEFIDDYLLTKNIINYSVKKNIKTFNLLSSKSIDKYYDIEIAGGIGNICDARSSNITENHFGASIMARSSNCRR